MQVRYEGVGSSQPSWSLMLPELQAAVVRVKTVGGVPLDAAGALEEAPPSDTATVGGGADQITCRSWNNGPKKIGIQDI